jgi:uncharacterized protein YgiM (DUF1202 family)
MKVSPWKVGLWRHDAPVLAARAAGGVVDHALLTTGIAGAQSGGDASSTTPASGLVSVARLNLRASPSISAPVVTRLTQGTAVQILAASTDKRWYQVATADASEGWLYAIYVTLDPAAPATRPQVTDTPVVATSETVSQPAVATTFAPGAVVATTTPARMNVRGGPGTNYPVSSSVAAGAQFEIIGLNPARDWYQVRVPNRTDPAWIFASLATVSGDLTSVPQLAEADLPAAPAPAPAQLQRHRRRRRPSPRPTPAPDLVTASPSTRGRATNRASPIW